jgi:DNA-binding CsgD family transcriptional regulator
MDEGLVDRIYEAGAVPELWTGVLDGIARIAGGIGGAFLVPSLGRWMSTPGIEEMMADLMTTGLISNNERTRRLLSLTPVGFYRDLDIFDLEDLPSEPVYRDFFIPRGGGFGTATVIDSPSGDRMILHVERARPRGLVEQDAVARLDALRPHLARASLLSSRLQLRQASTIAETLEKVGLAGAVLDRLGRIMTGNRLLDGLVPAVVQDRRNRLTLADKHADQLMATAIAAVGRPHASPAPVQSIPVPATDGAPPIVIHVLPVRGAAHDVFSASSAIVILTPVTPQEVPSAEVVQGLFDLTPSEARIARQVGNGSTPGEIASTSGRSELTVRTQLKSILAKTGLRRQSDLVGLLRGIPKVGGPER